jgi:hypothetical protein
MHETSFTSEPEAIWPGDIIAGKIQTENWSAELQATREQLVLIGPRGLHFQLRAESVREIRIGIGRFLFFSWIMKTTIRIVHSESGIAAVLAFRARRAKASEILVELQALGYNVATGEPEVT